MSSELLKNGGKILAFSCEFDYYAFDIMAVCDIIEIPSITKIPKTPAYIKGLMNHRGKAVPVMDFRERLGVEYREYTRKSCVIVIEVNSHQIGVMVDRVFDVYEAAPEQITPSPVKGGVVSAFAEINGFRISILNVNKLVRGGKTNDKIL